MQEVLYLLGFWKPFLSIRATLSLSIRAARFRALAGSNLQLARRNLRAFEEGRSSPRQARPRQLDHVVSGGEISGNAIGKLGENIDRNAKRRL
jgi:hypothetical protein